MYSAICKQIQARKIQEACTKQCVTQGAILSDYQQVMDALKAGSRVFAYYGYWEMVDEVIHCEGRDVVVRDMNGGERAHSTNLFDRNSLVFIAAKK